MRPIKSLPVEKGSTIQSVHCDIDRLFLLFDGCLFPVVVVYAVVTSSIFIRGNLQNVPVRVFVCSWCYLLHVCEVFEKVFGLIVVVDKLFENTFLEQMVPMEK